MSVALWLALGLLFGWLAGMVAGNGAGRLTYPVPTYLVLGSVGALVGGFLFSLFGGLDPSVPGVVTAMIGAFVILSLYLGIRRRRA